MAYGGDSGETGFRPNRLVEKWAKGEATLNGWLSLPNPSVAETMAHAGWDSLTLDMQHGLIDYSDAVPMLIAISTTPVVPLIRVPWLEEGIIMKALDAGAYGVICPMVNTKEEAQRFARACKYPPQGVRSLGPIRAKLYAGTDYRLHADDATLAIAMIETARAIDNLEGILGVEEIQAVYVGPADLSLALGVEPGFDQEDPTVVSAIEHIVGTAKRMGKRVGVHNMSVSYARRMIALGTDLVTVGSDMRLMAAGARKVVEDFRKGS